MMRTKNLHLLALLAGLAACSNDEGAEGAAAPAAASAAVQALVLGSDPGEAVGVVAAKQAGASGRVVVEGRVHDITKGFAMLKLMDTSMEYCGQVDADDGCKTPWDYCCDAKAARVAHSLLVEFRGASGRPLTTPTMPGTRLCDLVKVTGELVVDDHGNPVLVADGLFRVERPELPDYVKWPSGT